MSKASVRVTFALILFAGLWLRFTQLSGQVLWGDELLTLRAALRYDSLEILTHFGGADYCIPLTWMNHLLLKTVGISELGVRLPPLFFGAASLIVFPLLVREFFGSATALIFSLFLAVSPFHVSMSRFARPYPISLFLVTLGLFAVYQLHESKDRRLAWVYVPCAILAPYFHLSTLLVAVAPPLLLTLGVAGGKPSAKERAFQLRMLLLIAAGLGLLLLPPFWVDHASLTQKALGSPLEWRALLDAASLLLGTPVGGILSLLLVGLAGLGIREGLSRSRLSALMLWTAALQLLFTIGVRTQGMNGPVLARFNLISLPILLIFVSLGVERSAAVAVRFFRLPAARVALAFGLLVSLAQIGPLSSAFFRTDGWIALEIWRQLIWPDGPSGPPRFLRTGQIPEFYRQLASRPPGSTPIAEAPWYRAGPGPHMRRQQTHGQPVLIGLVSPDQPLVDTLDRPVRYSEEINRLLGGFRNFALVSDPAGLRNRGVKYVVFHRDLEGELDPDHDPGYERYPMDRWLALYRSQYGEPAYQDSDIVVFDLSGRG